MFSIMPYCTFCSKWCASAPGLERHITSTPECKKTSRPSSFEIFPEGQHMADLIFVTFIFVEKLQIKAG